ncbi:MAG TPA: shikimate dehydrogenase [Thermopetrobacter sp.]|nr:shikimate dehydrogenase [Thermopetrobacter sp.]
MTGQNASESDAVPRACVIGWPVEHSRSPLIHEWWLKELGLPGRYEKRAVPPGELREFLLSLPRSGRRGCNVTVPHKEAAFRILRDAGAVIHDAARRLAAVNTVWLEGDRLHADNTDVHGFMANFRAHCPDWRPREHGNVLVVGAGGAARAVVAAFLEAGAENVTVANRTVEKAERLAEDLGPGVTAIPFDDAAGRLPETDVLVNATTLGMEGRPPLPLDIAALPAHAIVADIVYVPLRTPLLAAAAARGLRTVEGLGMLLHQAVPGFEKWFGRRPRVTEALYRHLAADLE